MDWGAVFKEALKFFPRWEILDEDEGGLLLRCGKLKRVLGAGVWFCLPFFDQITRYTIALNHIDTTNQSITSKDKKEILVSWKATYLVAEPVKAFLLIDDIEETISAAIGSRLVDYISKHDYQDIKGHLLKNYLLQQHFVAEFSEEWGISLVGFFPKDLGLHRIFRLISPADMDQQ